MEDLNITALIVAYNEVISQVPELGLTEISISSAAIILMELAATYFLPGSIIDKLPKVLRFVYLFTKVMAIVNEKIEKLGKTGGGFKNEPEFEYDKDK